MSEPLHSTRLTFRLIQAVRAFGKALSRPKRGDARDAERSFVYRDGLKLPGNERIYLPNDSSEGREFS